MNYYDNVKDTVKGKSGNSGGDASFDTLKEEAEKTSVEEDEERGDGTPIEVLEDGGLREEAPGKSSEEDKNSESSGSSDSGSNPFTGKEDGSGSQQDLSSLEKKLDRIIEQNDQMIEILESFAS